MDGKPQASLSDLFNVFFKIGLMSFGGGLVSWIHRDVVIADRKSTRLNSSH